MSLQRFICYNDTLTHAYTPCKYELGRIRSVILFDLQFEITQFIELLQTDMEAAKSMFDSAYQMGLVHIIANTSGTYNGGEPKTADGYYQDETRLLRHNYNLQFNDPSFEDNLYFWQQAEHHRWYIAWKTETLLRLVSQPVNIVATDPVEDELTSTITWHIEATWSSKVKPDMSALGFLEDYFEAPPEETIYKIFTQEFTKEFV